MTKTTYFPTTKATVIRLLLASVLALSVSLLSVGPAVHATGTVTHNITASVEGHGIIEPSGIVPVDEGLDQPFYITPDIGYQIKYVLVDSVSVGAVSEYTFTNVQAPHTIKAVFELKENSFPGVQIPVPFSKEDTNTLPPDADGDVTDPQNMVGVGDCDSDEGDASVWYNYMPTETEYLAVDTLGSDYDTLIAVWTDTSGPEGLVACNDTDPRPIAPEDNPNTSGLVFKAKAGVTYYIEVIRRIRPGTVVATGGGTLNFHVQKVTETQTVTFRSQKKYDGWVLEKSETSGKGGSRNYRSKTILVGDDYYDRQYRSILSFNTSSLPSDAVIASAKLRVLRAGIAGTNPYSTHGGLLVDINSPKFGTKKILQVTDFQAKADANKIGKFKKSATWNVANLYAGAFKHISNTNTTQFRLRFSKDDNNDNSADYIKFYSGNAVTSKKPQLVIVYYGLPPLPPP